MKNLGKFVGATVVLSAVAFGVAIWTVPSLRQRCKELWEQAEQDFSQRERDLIAALSPSDEEIAAAQARRASHADAFGQ